MSDTKCQCGKCHTCRHRAAVTRARAARLIMRAVQTLKNNKTVESVDAATRQAIEEYERGETVSLDSLV